MRPLDANGWERPTADHAIRTGRRPRPRPLVRRRDVDDDQYDPPVWAEERYEERGW